VGKLTKVANRLAKEIYRKHERTAAFLKTHVERSDSMSARILVSAMGNIGPKFAAESRQAAKRRVGLYGFPHKTAKTSLGACSSFREEANRIAMDLHQRRTAKHEKITGYLGQHSKEAGCDYSSALLRYYPDAGMKVGTKIPETVDEWLGWGE
jgi:hypothetical protein